MKRALKYLLMVIGLIFLDQTLRYVTEQADIVDVRPHTVVKYGNNHLYNITAWLPYIFILMGWAYLAVVIVFDQLKRRIKKPKFVLNSIIGGILFIIAFTIYWLFDDYGTSNGPSYMIQGLLVYSILGICLELLHRSLFKEVN